MSKKIAVLIAHYNREDLLKRSLWFLKNQINDDFFGGYDEYEVWIIDDGSDS